MYIDKSQHNDGFRYISRTFELTSASHTGFADDVVMTRADRLVTGVTPEPCFLIRPGCGCGKGVGVGVVRDRV